MVINDFLIFQASARTEISVARVESEEISVQLEEIKEMEMEGADVL